MALSAQKYSKLVDLMHHYRAKRIPLAAVKGWLASEGVSVNTAAAIYKLLFDTAKTLKSETQPRSI